MSIRAVFFDAGETLIHHWALKTERFRWLCQAAGIPLPDDDVWSDAWRIRRNRTGLAAAGVEGDLDAMAAHILATSRTLPKAVVTDPEAVSLLEYLRGHGYRLAIVSNWDGTLIEAMRSAGLAGYFDAVLDSAVVGVGKPDARMFEIACAATGVAPHEAIHIGDSPCADVAGAQAAGVRPVLLDALDLFGDGFYDLPAFDRIGRLADLPAWLEAHNPAMAGAEA